MKEPPPKPTYRSVETSLKSVVKNNLVTEKLTNAAFWANNIMIHALQLLKLYLLHCCDVGDELSKLDRRLVTSVMKVLCKAPSTGSPPSTETQVIMDTLKDLYKQHYKAYMSEELSYEHMSTVIEYLSTDVIIMYENNIKQNYVAYVERYEFLKDKTVVAIDPNMSDLLYCVDGDTNDQTRFRYTQDMCRRETKAKKHWDYVQERKREVIDGKRIVGWEAELSAYNRKTTDFERFKAYVEKKNEVNRRLSRVYNKYIFRKLKLGSYMLHTSPDNGSSTPEAIRGAVRKRSRHDRRDRGLEPEAAPQVQGAHQWQGL